MSGQIVDASLVAAARRRNTKAEKADIKAEKIPEAWKDKPAKLRHKGRDARWTELGCARTCWIAAIPVPASGPTPRIVP